MRNGDDALWNAATLTRLLEEDAVGQLRRRDGKMAELGSENGELKLDWVGYWRTIHCWKKSSKRHATSGGAAYGI